MKLLVVLLALFAATFAADNTIDRVKGGSVAGAGEFPYQVSVWFNNQHICGGALVTTKHVVTAASCLVIVMRNPDLASNLRVVVGTINQERDGIIYKLKRVSIHPEYQYNQQWASFENDIGVIHLSENVRESPFVKQVNLPILTELPPNAELTFTGWGSTSGPYGQSVQILQKAKLLSINQQECQRYFANVKVKMYQLCTSANNYVGTCTTDVGGPLVYGNQLVGISTGLHGCAGGTPDVFTKVSYYLKYIMEEINYEVMN